MAVGGAIALFPVPSGSLVSHLASGSKQLGSRQQMGTILATDASEAR